MSLTSGTKRSRKGKNLVVGGGGGGWFSGDHFWNEAQQITITLLAILLVVCLLLIKATILIRKIKEFSCCLMTAVYDSCER